MPIYTDPEQQVENDLQRLLLRAVPDNEHGRKTLTHLATLIPCTRWAIQKWIINGKIAPEKVLRIVEIGEGRVKREDFDDYVYKT